LGSQLGPIDVMTLDIVALLFDFILDDQRIPDALKALIGRLQIPVLKVAMLDKDFFSHKTHPARLLLDALAAAAFGWDASEGHEGGLYLKSTVWCRASLTAMTTMSRFSIRRSPNCAPSSLRSRTRPCCAST
jgi:hypothetical protein